MQQENFSTPPDLCIREAIAMRASLFNASIEKLWNCRQAISRCHVEFHGGVVRHSYLANGTWGSSTAPLHTDFQIRAHNDGPCRLQPTWQLQYHDMLRLTGLSAQFEPRNFAEVRAAPNQVPELRLDTSSRDLPRLRNGYPWVPIGACIFFISG